MKSLLLTLTLFASVFTSIAATAQEKEREKETCTLQTYASSWMATGTPFSAKCPSAVYTGTLIATPSRRFFKRGHLVLKFDQPVAAVAQKNGEGVFKAGRGKQITSMMLSGGSGIGTKDIFDGLSGTIFKSWYMIPITFTALAVFEKGGDVNLKPGFRLQIVKTRVNLEQANPQ
jgi:hypothetical protein